MSLESSSGVKIYQGEDKDLVIRLANPDGTPFDLTNASIISVLLKNADGSVLTKSLAVSGQITPLNAGGGIFKARITAADSVLLNLGDNQAIEVRVTIGGYLTITQIQNAISVLASLFPGT